MPFIPQTQFAPRGGDINLAGGRDQLRPQMQSQSMPVSVGQGGVGQPGGMVPPPQGGDGRGGGVNPGASGPHPNAQAYAHANEHASFMRAQPGGDGVYAHNPMGQRPAMHNALVPQDPQAEFRRRQFAQEMMRRMQQGGMQGYGGDAMSGFKPWQGGGMPAGSPEPSGPAQYPNVYHSLNPDAGLMTGAPSGGFYAYGQGGSLSDMAGAAANAYQLQNQNGGGYQALPQYPTREPIQSMYNLASPF